MSIDALKEMLPDFARDMRVNLGNLLMPEGDADGLTAVQRAVIAQAVALNSRQSQLQSHIASWAGGILSAEQMNGAAVAASIMAMNNVYYRFTHLVEQPDYATMPAGLRMTMMAKSGLPSVDFELASIAVSAANGCGMCMASHERKLRAEGVSAITIQSAVKIAAVLNAVAHVLDMSSAQPATMAQAA